MRGNLTLVAALALAVAAPAHAKSAMALDEAAGGGPAFSAGGVLQCVPYARDTSGIRLYGDAHTWWNQAAGKYARGRVPRPGAVLAIRPHGNSTLGHVATVSRVVDARTILISHANWSSPGQIERNVTAIDVSPANDWSQVRVWFSPIRNLGGSHWPVAGFIYNARPGAEPKAPFERQPQIARVKPGKAEVSFTRSKPASASRFAEAFAALGAEKPAKPARSPVRLAKAEVRKDPIGAILAKSR